MEWYVKLPYHRRYRLLQLGQKKQEHYIKYCLPASDLKMSENIISQINDLLSLNIVSNMSFIINSSCIKSSSCFFKGPSRYQYVSKLFVRQLTFELINIALNYFNTPFLEDICLSILLSVHSSQY